MPTVTPGGLVKLAILATAAPFHATEARPLQLTRSEHQPLPEHTLVQDRVSQALAGAVTTQPITHFSEELLRNAGHAPAANHASPNRKLAQWGVSNYVYNYPECYGNYEALRTFNGVRYGIDYNGQCRVPGECERLRNAYANICGTRAVWGNWGWGKKKS